MWETYYLPCVYTDYHLQANGHPVHGLPGLIIQIPGHIGKLSIFFKVTNGRVSPKDHWLQISGNIGSFLIEPEHTIGSMSITSTITISDRE